MVKIKIRDQAVTFMVNTELIVNGPFQQEDCNHPWGYQDMRNTTALLPGSSV